MRDLRSPFFPDRPPLRLVMTLPTPGRVAILCPKGCGFSVSARGEGHAINAIANHIATAHWPEWVERVNNLPEPRH